MSSKRKFISFHISHWPLVGAIALFLVAVMRLTVQNMGTDAAGGVWESSAVRWLCCAAVYACRLV